MKNRSWFFFISILLLGVLSGFQSDLPKSDTIQKSLPIKNSSTSMQERSVITANQIPTEKQSLFVHYQTKGNNLFVECIVTGISFRELDQSQQKVGKIIVWLDGKKKQEADAAAFIIKGLTNGNHQLKLEVVNLKNEPYGLSKEFDITIHQD
ncbi:hypothetical protein [Neobacillus sp. PS3-40]|uniref:hypothetical protein n=1 Tax=Neobacillus sp. PS3-40 TaxID=3070679 RepID=UPI0027DED7FB|nr:hypothetical protein [Neobacillus sp. PS3-40]WML43583.1 hypothetical protein RCG20_17580 [Neobacillus sp. PS3-40]